MTFDYQLVEAELAAGLIGPEQMPSLAWDALEAGHDGPSIRRVASLVNPSGWEVDQLKPKFMAEVGLRSIPLEDASVLVAKRLADRILSEELDPLAHTRAFQTLWIRADYPAIMQDVGLLAEQKTIARYIGQSEAELRRYAREVLLTFAKSAALSQ